MAGDTPPGVGWAMLVDPHVVVIGPNIRRTPVIDQAFRDSIAALGVLQPITCYRNEKGELVAREGQRRLLAARQVGVEHVPVVVVPAPTPVELTCGQLDENTQRTCHSAGDEVAALCSLTELGLTVADIAKRTRRSPEAVTAAVQLGADLERADALAEQYPELSLTDLAVMAEFAGDEYAQTRLGQVLGSEQAGHTIAALRARAERRRRIQAARAEAEAQGVTVVDLPESWHDGYQHTRAVTSLRPAHSPEPLTDQAHAATCPGHAVAIVVETDWVEPDGGGPLSPVDTITTVGVCTNFRTHGHRAIGPDRLTAAQMTEEERATAAAANKQVRQNNAASDAAVTVRRAWLKDFAHRKTPPPGAGKLIHLVLASHASTLTHHQAGHLAQQWGLASTGARKLSDATATHLALMRVLAGLEATMPRDFWRHSNPATAAYLQALKSFGYPLSTLETTYLHQSTNPPQDASAPKTLAR